jgi:hypothetical protein
LSIKKSISDIFSFTKSCTLLLEAAMKKRFLPLLFHFLTMVIFAAFAYSQSCTISPFFDAGAVYTYTVYLSPEGSDTQGDGTLSQPYRSLQKATENATPGLQVLLLPGTYPGGLHLSRLQGTASHPIRIASEDRAQPAILSGGGTGIQLSDPAYLVLEDFIIEECTSNGLNIDDGGSYDTPAHHLVLRRMHIRKIGPTGNRDGIKLSGVDHFLVDSCVVDQPGDGGSAIDMVGCHDGIFFQNTLTNFASSGIQAKGGSQRILIYANRFEGGARAINMGGSTGMQFFRPLDASAEASHITVWANLFLANQAPIAFVGCENGLFAHNTILHPTKWVARILQENNHAQMIQCRNNVFVNNVVVFDQQVQVFVNVGGNTHPDTFVFARNLWYHDANPAFRTPNLPVIEIAPIPTGNPLFKDIDVGDYSLSLSSPAIGQAVSIEEVLGARPITIPGIGDFQGQCYSIPATLGAFRGIERTSVDGWKSDFW